VPPSKTPKAKGECHAIARIFNLLRSRLVATAVAQTGNHATAEDLVQDSWLKVEQATHSTTIDNPAAFITKVVSHTVLDHLRKERRRAEIDAEVSSILWESQDDKSPERVASSREHLESISKALNELPERTRQIFMRNRFEQISHRRIAEHYDISEEAVYYHIKRALEHLAKVRDSISETN
tara:strand:+ start:50429 stop:50971 length:543 start_codon:yes stop_codon:yes gene_type:complete